LSSNSDNLKAKLPLCGLTKVKVDWSNIVLFFTNLI
jgi:hypothetical protein